MRLTTPVRSLGGFCLFASSMWAAGCSRVQDATPITNEQYISVPGAVGFDIAPVEVEGPGSTFLATYSSNGKTARFRIELNSSKPLDDKESRIFSVESGKGRLVAEPGSDASALLLELKKALEAKVVPSRVEKIADLPSLM